MRGRRQFVRRRCVANIAITWPSRKVKTPMVLASGSAIIEKPETSRDSRTPVEEVKDFRKDLAMAISVRSGSGPEAQTKSFDFAERACLH